MTRANAWKVILSAATGAAAMWLGDPRRGRYRRAMLRDKAKRLRRELTTEVQRAGHDLANRTRGLLTEAKHAREEGRVDDDVLVERVRAALGHHVEHARFIKVHADHGTVTLSGYADPIDAAHAKSAAAHVRGVERVEDQIHVG